MKGEEKDSLWGSKLKGYYSTISTFLKLDIFLFLLQLYNYNNSVSTYLLRKQAAAAEGGNRREEAERKERDQRI